MRAIQTVDTNYTDIMRYFNKDWNIEAYDIHRKVLQDKDAEYEELGITGHSIYFLYEKDVVSKQIHVYVGRSSDTGNCIPAFTRLRNINGIRINKIFFSNQHSLYNVHYLFNSMAG